MCLKATNLRCDWHMNQRNAAVDSFTGMKYTCLNIKRSDKNMNGLPCAKRVAENVKWKKWMIKVSERITKNGDERSGVLRLHFEWSPGQLTGVVGFKVHFPQYVSMKSGPPAANVITANKSCNISQRFLCYIYQKVYTSSVPLTEVGVRIDIISLFNIRSRHNICSATIKSNNITFISFAFLFYNME